MSRIDIKPGMMGIYTRSGFTFLVLTHPDRWGHVRVATSEAQARRWGIDLLHDRYTMGWDSDVEDGHLILVPASEVVGG